MLTSDFKPLRREDPVLLTGQGCYTGDVPAADAWHAVFVRSPQAHGQIRHIDTQVALAAPGVEAVLTAATLTADGMPVWMPAPNPLLPFNAFEQIEPLARDQVVYVGQPVALVLARTLAQAQQAAQAVQLEIDALPPVLDFQAGRTVCEVCHGSGAGEDEGVAFGAPDPQANPQQVEREKVRVQVPVQPQAHVPAQPQVKTPVKAQVQVALEVPRVLALSMEPRGTLALWRAATESHAAQLTVHLGTQSPSRAQADIARALGWDAAAVRVVTGHVGGAFGAKSSLSPEDLAIALAARRVGHSVRWAATRSEEFIAGMHGRGARLQGQLAVDEQGKFLALQASLQFTVGAWLPFSAAIPLRNTARILPGPYRVAALQVEGKAAMAHTAPVTIYRGAGRPEAALLMETLVDKAARALGMDPVALRRQNVIEASAMPYTTPSGEVFDSGNYLHALDLACQHFAYAEQREQQRLRRAQGEVVGLGVALYVEPCGMGWESARVDWYADGRVTVASGSPAQGQGHGTTYARIAAEALGLSPADVTVVYGDTAQCPSGIGALASRSTAIGGSAIVQACRNLLARRAAGEALPLSAEERFTAQETWSYGCVMTRLSVDRHTGRPTVEQITWVDDAGNIVEPALAHGQLVGGLVQGLGQALLEQLVYDSAGQLLSGSLMDYAVPRAEDVPPIEIYGMATPSPLNLLGAKGVGEAGCIGVPAALMSAARDALSVLGECELQFPLSSEQLWRAMEC